MLVVGDPGCGKTSLIRHLGENTLVFTQMDGTSIEYIIDEHCVNRPTNDLSRYSGILLVINCTQDITTQLNHWTSLVDTYLPIVLALTHHNSSGNEQEIGLIDGYQYF